MPMIRKLATLAATAEAARRYAKANPEKAGKFLDQAAAFVDKQTKGKFRTQIEGAKRSAKGAAGIREDRPYGAATDNGLANGSTSAPSALFEPPATGRPATH
ncbi:antitoxin [Pseudonocardia sp. GCM10023141]|uniref:antitoxin n=1 Tax=Pseudonocardia sp. GCM10023141 TaxID=3252653 RepID=UPI00360C8615